MICNYCGNELPPTLLKWKVYQPTGSGPVETSVCGKCFILIDILRVLKEINDGKSGRSKLQVFNGDED